MVVVLHTTHVLATVTIADGDGGLYKEDEEDELEDSVDGGTIKIRLLLLYKVGFTRSSILSTG